MQRKFLQPSAKIHLFPFESGCIIRTGFDEELPSAQSARQWGSNGFPNLELRERERTGIRKLKVGYNKVFGYYIDVPRAAGDQVPDDYIRKTDAWFPMSAFLQKEPRS